MSLQLLFFVPSNDARWVKKGRKGTLGHKGFARCDEEGLVDKIHTTPANVGQSPRFGTMIKGSKAQRILLDKAYASKANRGAVKGKQSRWYLAQGVARALTAPIVKAL